MSTPEDIRKLIHTHQRRLQKLKEKQAAMGINTPAEVSIEIEDIEAKLKELSDDLAAEQAQLEQTLAGTTGLASPVAAQIRQPIEQRLPARINGMIGTCLP